MDSENYKREIKLSLNKIIDETQSLKNNLENCYNYTYAEIRKKYLIKKKSL